MALTKEIEEIILASKTIAVVGASRNPMKAAHSVPKYLQKKGYRIIPVNPKAERILGEKCYANLRAIPKPVDIVDIFRPAEATAAIVKEAIILEPKLIWLQLGIKSKEAKAIAKKYHIPFIQDHCLMVEHAKLVQ
ncbi:MAG: CoA-binding protein [Candidatus Heimdallarchaeota archaeon]|nr:CoA-binding protein [Candidatus Heimdallarchaeota archaeon]